MTPDLQHTPLKFKRGEAGEGYEAFRKNGTTGKWQGLCLVTFAGALGMVDPDGPDAGKWVATDMRIATPPWRTRREAALDFIRIASLTRDLDATNCDATRNASGFHAPRLRCVYPAGHAKRGGVEAFHKNLNGDIWESE